MPQSPQKPLEKLPNPELNPLLNPTLGNNLGRWAQAYFTSPPEKREEAVLELLHELEAEGGSAEVTQSNSGAEPSWLHSLEGAQLNPALTCAECGHKNAPQQRFCGMCGSRLIFADSPVEADLPAQLERTPDPTELSSPIVPSQPVPSFGSLSLFATASSAEADSGSGVQWLQEKSYDSDLGMESSGSSKKYYVTALGLLLLGVLLYVQWKPQKGHPVAASSPSSATHPVTARQEPSDRSTEPAAQPPAQPAANNQVPTEGQTAAKTAQTQSAQESSPAAQNAPPATQTPATPRAPEPHPAPVQNAATVQPESPASATSAAGAADLATAEGYLTGRYGSRNSSEAARYLWKAVAKENPTAIMLLSNLYLAGDGVPKSCDQAKLLLRAGAQKNISEAANKLRELQRRGCP